MSQVALKVDHLVVGYDKPLLPKLKFSIRSGQKLVITGFNGIGKSTLLKTLVGEIQGITGRFQFAEQVKVGYFEQDLTWEDETMTPIQVISAYDPNISVS